MQRKCFFLAKHYTYLYMFALLFNITAAKIGIIFETYKCFAEKCD